MRYLHTMVRVFDLDRSLDYYCKVLGFTLRARHDHEKGRFTLAFLTTGEGDGEVELTYNWDQKEPYQLGNAYGHMAFRVDSLETVGKRLAEHGLKFSWGPGNTPGGNRGMAFVEDPDGYEIELLEG
jgi:lactoylglutathione lyase